MWGCRSWSPRLGHGADADVSHLFRHFCCLGFDNRFFLVLENKEYNNCAQKGKCQFALLIHVPISNNSTGESKPWSCFQSGFHNNSRILIKCNNKSLPLCLSNFCFLLADDRAQKPAMCNNHNVWSSAVL